MTEAENVHHKMGNGGTRISPSLIYVSEIDFRELKHKTGIFDTRTHPHRHQYCQAQGQGLSPVAGPSIGSGGRYLPPPATKYKHDNINSDFKYFFPASFMASCNDVKQQKEGQITLVLMNLVPASPNLDATSGARQAWGLKIIST